MTTDQQYLENSLFDIIIILSIDFNYFHKIHFSKIASFLEDLPSGSRYGDTFKFFV